MALKIADRWFERRRIGDDITLLWEPHREDTLDAKDFGPDGLRYLVQAGYEMPKDGAMITAVPAQDYDPSRFRLLPAKATRVVEDGDVLDIGGRRFEIMHLPGHSPGSIGL